jgi:AcrR family transcriptional regulator
LKPPGAKTKPSRTMRDRLRAVTRDTLLRASEQIFAEKGIDGARVEDIAVRAGVAVGTIYNYFGDSGELLNALIVARRQDLIAHLDQALAQAQRQRTSWSGQVEAFIRSTLDCTREHLPFYAILLQCENRKTPSSMGGVSADFYKRAERLVQTGVDLGLVRRADSALLPAVLVMLCRAPLLLLRQAGPHPSWNDAHVEQIVRFFCSAVASGPAQPSDRARPVKRRARKTSSLPA